MTVQVVGINSLVTQGNAVERDVERLRDATGQVVGSVFFGTLLKTMRESKLQGPYGHGGRGEEVFAAQLHGMWAEQMGQASTSGASQALFHRLEKQQVLFSNTAKGGRT